MIMKLIEAMEQISDRHIAEAVGYKKRRLPRWIIAAAAVLALVVALTTLLNPLTLSANAVALAKYPQYEWKYLGDEMAPISAKLQSFFANSMQTTLSGSTDNNTYSPVNLYMALCLAAELSNGNEQILSLLNTDNIDTLRQQTNLVWSATYRDDGDQTLLANSVWLDSGLHYSHNLMSTLADTYYTSVYESDLQTPGTARAVLHWIREQTGGILEKQTKQPALTEETILALYSTVYYQAKWSQDHEFSAALNTQGKFHAPAGDMECTFMNKELMQSHYYWGQDFGAVSLSLKDGSSMWFVLPDVDKTTDDVLASEDLAALLADGYAYENSKYMLVNLSVPKFDISCNSDLKQDLQNMGITDIFQPGTADFSAAIHEELPMCFTAVNQATRVAIDEKGVTAASYIELPEAGAAQPPEEIIDFILDRPFLFVIQNRYDLPLFAGIVNEP